MLSLIAIEVVPDELIIMGNLVNLQISCDVHETDHSADVDNILENYTQSWRS